MFYRVVGLVEVARAAAAELVLEYAFEDMSIRSRYACGAAAWSLTRLFRSAHTFFIEL